MDYLPGQYQLNTMCNLHFGISNICYYGGSWVNEEVLVRVCDDGGVGIGLGLMDRRR